MDREVLEFVIVPPYEQRAAVAAAKERFEDYLARRFPGFTFEVGPLALIGDDEKFRVLPTMKFVDDDGRSYICDSPSRWIIREICQVCAEFELSGNGSILTEVKLAFA